MNRLSNTDITYVHMSYMVRRTSMLEWLLDCMNCGHQPYLTVRRMFTTLHQRLGDTGSFRTNRMAAGRPERICAENEEGILQQFSENPGTNTWAIINWMKIACDSDVDIWRVHLDNQLGNYTLTIFWGRRCSSQLTIAFPNSSHVGSWEWKLRKEIFRSAFSPQMKLILCVVVCPAHTAYTCDRTTSLT